MVDRMRTNSDEGYVLDICDAILGLKALRQHRFDFLRGDTRTSGRPGVRLPVDGYYPNLALVVEYMERQHSEAVAFFDRKATLSGVSRGVQRAIYDRRRHEVLPANGLRLVLIQFSDLDHHLNSRRLKRNQEFDSKQIRRMLLA